MTTIEFCEKMKHNEEMAGESFYDMGLFTNISSVLGWNPLLWLLPVGGPAGDGINFPVPAWLSKDQEEEPAADEEAQLTSAASASCSSRLSTLLPDRVRIKARCEDPEAAHPESNSNIPQLDETQSAAEDDSEAQALAALREAGGPEHADYDEQYEGEVHSDEWLDNYDAEQDQSCFLVWKRCMTTKDHWVARDSEEFQDDLAVGCEFIGEKTEELQLRCESVGQAFEDILMRVLGVCIPRHRRDSKDRRVSSNRKKFKERRSQRAINVEKNKKVDTDGEAAVSVRASSSSGAASGADFFSD